MKQFRWLAAAALVVTMGFALAACGGDDDDEDGSDVTPGAVSTQPASATEPASTAEPTAEATEPEGDATEPAGDGVDNISVTAADFSFSTDAESVAPGSVVMVAFSNTGSAPHTLTFYADEEYTEAIPAGDSGQVSGGSSVNFTFEAPESGDDVYYRCEVHPAQMQGELAVE